MNGAAQSSFSLQNLMRGADVSSTVAALRGVLRNPTGNTTLSLLLLSAAVLIVVLLVVFVLMLVTPSRKKVVKVRRYTGAAAAEAAATAEASGEGSIRRVEAPREPPSRLFMVLTGPIAVTALILLASVGTYAVTSMNAYCAETCHGRSESVKDATEIDHAACVSCHETGWLAVFSNASSRARMVAAYAVGRSPARTSQAVDSHSCLNCHGEVGDTTTTSRGGIRMSHKEVMAAGQPCTECHSAQGHHPSAFTASMSACITCHDSRTAKAECSLCHTKEPASSGFAAKQTRETLGTGDIVYPAVRASNRDCGGCHDQARQCDPCHGLRMPHSDEFRGGGHARPAAFTSKVVCWTCHDPQWCGNTGCHGAFDPSGTRSSHGPGWEQEHKGAPWGGGCACHAGRSGRTESMCYLCHAPDRSLLPIRQ